MNLSEYQKQAARTEGDYPTVAERFVNDKEVNSFKLNHAVIGITGEAGELASAIQRAYYYGQGVDKANIVEELGDLLWYIALACNTLGVEMSDVMNRNIAKLQKRYPDKYTDAHAAEQNRNRVAEREVIIAPKCQYCPHPATCQITWKKGNPGQVGPVTVPYCGQCSIKDALAKRGMTAPVTQGQDYTFTQPLAIEQSKDIVVQDGHGFGHVEPARMGTIRPASSRKRTRAEVLAARGSMFGCCNRYVDQVGCDCLELAESAEPIISLPPEPALAPEQCESCKQPATRAVHDSSKDGNRRETHWYCRAHDRQPNILNPI